MQWFSHVRFWFWDSQRYTAAQTQELQALQTLHKRHLAHVFEQRFLSLLTLRTEGERHYSDRVVTSNHEELAFLDIASEDIVYMQEMLRWLASAPADAATLDRIQALLAYLAAVQSTRVFVQEPQGYHSMHVVLDNLQRSLRVVQARVHYKMSERAATDVVATQETGSEEQQLPRAKCQQASCEQVSDLNQLFKAFATIHDDATAESVNTLVCRNASHFTFPILSWYVSAICLSTKCGSFAETG